MKELVNITSDPFQRHIVLLDEEEITIDLRFYPTIQQWFFDISYKTKAVNGVKLSLGVLHINNTNMPFDFIVVDQSANGIDPFKVDDFMDRCRLYMLDSSEMETFRGVPVAVQ